MDNKKDFFAFISYKHTDKKWAKWIQKKLEFYKLPIYIKEENPDTPENLRPIFRDETDMPVGGILSENIKSALTQSKFLIVICSPNVLESDYVKEEVTFFKELNGIGNIVPIIFDGEPNSEDESRECIPEPIREDVKNGMLAANVNEISKDYALVKVVAKMLDVRVDKLWRRYERDQKNKRRMMIIALLALMIAAICVAGWIWHQNVELEHKNWKIMENQSRFVAEKAKTILDTNSYLSSLLAIDVLPEDLLDPQRPYTPEAEFVLRQSMTRPMVILGRHDASIKTVDISSDGHFVLSASADGTIKIWNIHTGACKQTLQHNTQQNVSVRCARFSKDDKYVVSALSSNSIMIWDVSSGRCLDTLRGHSNQVWYAVFNVEGNQIASASVDRTIKIWDVDKDSCLATLIGHKMQVNSVEYNPADQTRLVSASMDNTIKLWDLNTDSCLRTMIGHTGYVNYAVFSPDGKHIASASSDSTIRIWDSNTGMIDTTLRQCNRVNSVKYSLDGDYLVSASEDTIKLWDIKTKKCIQAMKGHFETVSDVDFCPDGKLMVSCSSDRTIRIWNWNIAENNPIEHKVSSSPIYAQYSSDGKLIAYQTQEGVSEILDLESDSSIFSTQGTWGYPSFAYHGRLLATISNSEDSIKIWDVEANLCKYTITDIGKFSKSLAFSPIGDCIACYSIEDHSIEGCIKIIDIYDSHHKLLLDKSSGYKEKITFSPNGKYVCAQNGSIIRIWNAITGGWVLDYERKQMRGFAFHPYDDFIVIGSGVGLIIEDIETGKEIDILDEYAGFTDWDGQPCFSSDGKYLLSKSSNMIHVRDYKSGVCVQNIVTKSASFANSICFSPDGRYIMAGLYDGSIQIWDFSPLQELIEKTHERFVDRQLTPEERHQYYLEK
ncbi:MAG: TIR domain-containing protein [Bacteroidales bacterium]|nr:TIR domain-containing protein [Bacteroidales bacterium]